MPIRVIFSTIALLLLLVSGAKSQTFLETQRDLPAQSFPALQQQLDTWCRAHGASGIRGWKWLKRWEDFETKRMNPDGSLYDMAAYLKAVQGILDEKKATAKTTAGNSWYPLGPNDYAQSNDPGWETGIGRINCIAFHPTDPNIYWVGVAQGGVWKTVDDGQSWTPLTDDLPMLRVSDICVNPVNPAELYISVGDFEYFGAGLQLDDRKRHSHYGLGVYKTVDGGLTWNPTGLSVLQTDFDFSLTRRVFIHPSNTLTLVAAGTHGIWKTLDAGVTWAHVHDSIIWDIERDPVDPQILYASTGYRSTLNQGSAGILKSTDFGSTWTALTTGIPPRGTVQRIELAISATDHNYVYALCAGLDASFAGMYRSTDAGVTWTLQSNTPNILEWYDGSSGGGQGWYDLALLVSPTDRNTVYTGGINMWGSTDGGVTFDAVSYWRGDYGPSLHADQHQFAYNPLNVKYYVCDDGGLYSTSQILIGSWTDAQNTSGYNWPTIWEKKSSGMQVTSFYRCSTSPAADGNLIAGAQDNGTYFYNGTIWQNVIGGDGMECILHPTNPQVFYGSSQYGSLAMSYDGGATTNYLSSPLEYGEWTTPFVMHPDSSDILFAAYGNIFKSVDAGNSWYPISAMPVNGTLGQPNISSALAIAPSNPNCLYVAKRYYYSYGEPSALWVTTDQGANWVNRTLGLPDSLYLTSIEIDGDDPATAWVTVGGFVPGVKLFKTTDYGANWTNVSRNLPNLQCNTVVQDDSHPRNPIYVGLDVGVYYGNDTSSTYELYATDLPNVVISDLEFDVSNAQIVAATFGRGLWGVSLKDDVVSSIHFGNAQALAMTVVPNPNAGEFQIQLEGTSTETMQVQLIDIMGRVIHKGAVAPFEDGCAVPVLQSLAPGYYFARVLGSDVRLTVKFLVK